MVFYEIVITNVNDNELTFINNGDSYVSVPISPSIFLDIFLFNTIGNRLEAFSFLGATSNWLRNENPSTFPVQPRTFLIGDCIHIINAAPASALLHIGNGLLAPVDERSLAPNDDVWIIWNNEESRFSDTPCCVVGTTKVETTRGPVMIRDIRRGDEVLDYNHKKIQVHHNLRFIPSETFIKITANSLGPNKPTKDLLIRPGHPILLENTEVDPENLVKQKKGIRKIGLSKKEPVWSLCTKDRTFVMMQGLPVCTFAISDLNSLKRKKIFWQY
jgi:hypothetical protein